MQSSSSPEVFVKIGASTSGLTTGFDEAVRTTERGVSQMQAALGKLEASQVQAEMWTRRRAAAERDAYGVAQTMAAAQNRVSTAITAGSRVTEIAGARYAQAAQKSLLLANALTTSGASGASMAAKMIGAGSTIASIFGTGGIAVLAVTSFAALFMRQMNNIDTAARDTTERLKQGFKEVANAADTGPAMAALEKIWRGTQAENFKDGLVALRRRMAEFARQPGGMDGLKAQLERQSKFGSEQERAVAALRLREIEQVTLAWQRAEGEFKRYSDLVTDWKAMPTPGTARPVTAVDTTEFDLERAQAIEAEGRRVNVILEQQERERLETSREIAAERVQRIGEDEKRIQELIDATADQFQSRWESALDGITNAFGTAFAGIFDGTKTIGDSFRDLGRIILASMVGSIARSLTQFIAAQITMRVMGQATARQTVANSAVEAAANAFKATAGIPFIGPLLAPLAAAGAFAAVLSFGSGIASAAGGWGQVPEDQLAMVHKNEMILPAPIAETMRNLSEQGAATAGGGGSVTITAMDAQSFVEFLKRNGGSLAGVLKELERNGQLNLGMA